MQESLQQLAELLGTTVEYIWPLMIREQYLDVVRAAICVVLTSLFSYICYKAYLKLGCKSERNPSEESKLIVSVAGLIIFGSFLCIGTFILIAESIDLLNPEYAALKDVLNKIGK